MFGDFVWWQGVVEDRIDPLKLGRCRVRILGYHTNNKVDGIGIPTDHLPWATPVQPITSAAMNGIGTTPMGPVEGTWVFGFFRDGKDAQEPVMMGTFGGKPEDQANPKLGFNDPNGIYPLTTHLNEPDTNRLARGSGEIPVPLKSDGGKTSEDSPSLNYKRQSRTKGVPTAVAGDMSTTIDNTDNSALYEFTPWNEPNPRYGGVEDSPTDYLATVSLSSAYPFNHVRMSESGHVEEWDDTPNAERLHKFHKTGTFEEIQPDGTKVVKVVANDYEIVLGYKDVTITGTCNVTIGGDCRMLYQGDLVQEVYGDYHLNVHGDKRTKISGNEVTEVLADRKVVVNGNCDLKVGKDQIINIDVDRTINVLGNVIESISGDLKELTLGTMGTVVQKNVTLVSAEAIDITALGDMGFSTNSNCNITVTGNVVETITGNSTAQISGNSSINVLGTFKNKIGGTTHKEYTGAFYERWDGDKHTHTGADTFSRFDPGVDHSCPTDTRSPSAQSCADIQTTGL